LVTDIEDFDDAELDDEAESEPALARRIEITLTEDAAGQRLDRALAAAAALSRMRVQALLAAGRVTRDGAPVNDASAKARAGQRIVIDIPPPVAAFPQPQDIPLTVVFEDEDMMVIDKPAGLVVHPGAGNPDGTLVNALLAYCGDTLSGIGGVRRPGIVHRLDKDTSGLMVVAKTDRAHISLAGQLQTRTLKRIYTAVVWGKPMPPTGRIEGNIGRRPNDRKRMALVAHGGKPAVTHYRTLKSYKTASVVECRLETGRTHQIRVHMAHIGHPLVGDPAYGLKRLPKDAPALAKSLPRQALHATQVTFLHPVTNMEMCYSSPVPNDIAELIASMS
jgi:23S rRNA pseudouridine1911/1915/1917 synthase